MSEENKQVVLEYYKRFDSGDSTAPLELLADNYVCHFAGMPQAVPKDGMKGVIEAFWAAFPNFKHEIVEQFSDGDKVSTRLIFRAVHKGVFQHVPATGNSVEMEGLNVSHFEDGKIVEHWAYPDMVSLLSQIGAIK